MAQIVCIIGNKGGTGKTTLSHMLCQGLGLLGHHSVCVLTDTMREPLDPEGRRYLVADARSREALVKVVDKLRTLNKWIGVIDGGANRSEMDRRLYGIAELVLLPFRDSHEDIRALKIDLAAFPRAFALPAQWPTNTWQQEAARKTVDQQLAEHRDRLLKPAYSLSASKLLLQRRVPADMPTGLANACRRLAGQVLDQLELGYDAAQVEQAGAESADDSYPDLPLQSRAA
ncbi:MAG: hypothetical protein JNJ60_08005 [Rhodocyclaceae bacterium]|nr:hypothetical protein [Rhodocyclaceae bacterium]